MNDFNFRAGEAVGDEGKSERQLSDGHEYEADSHEHRVCVEDFL